MALLDFITAPRVEKAGLVIAAVAAIFLGGKARIFAEAAIAVYLLSRYVPVLFAWIKFFAKPDTWPGYVALGIGCLFAAHTGGWPAVFFVAGVLATGVGRLFNQLY